MINTDFLSFPLSAALIMFVIYNLGKHVQLFQEGYGIFSADLQSALQRRMALGLRTRTGPTLTFVFCTHLHGEMKERQEERESDGSKWK